MASIRNYHFLWVSPLITMKDFIRRPENVGWSQETGETSDFFFLYAMPEHICVLSNLVFFEKDFPFI